MLAASLQAVRRGSQVSGQPRLGWPQLPGTGELAWEPSCASPRAHCRASADRQAAPALPAAVVTAAALAMAHPLAAEAAVTPTLKNLLSSVLAGGVILGAIAAAITFVSNFDQIKRRL